MFFRKKKTIKGGTVGDGELLYSPSLLRNLTVQFAIGDEVRLRPEFVQELEVDSIVVGLIVNKQVIYRNEDIHWDEGAKSIAFYAREEERTIASVDEVALLLPVENSNDRNLAYHRKVELSRIGLFKRGNTITVMSKQGGRRSYAIDGVVVGYQLLKQGLFAHHEVAVLELQPESFAESERRKHQRLLTNVPTTIKVLKGEHEFKGRLVDFSEHGAHLNVTEQAAAPLLLEGKPVLLQIVMAELKRSYRLEGTILKVAGNELVVGLRNIFKDGAFTPFSALDGIEIKAMLSKLPQSRIG